MSKEIKDMYRKAGLKPPDGKGVHTKEFHRQAIGVKKENPGYPMQRAYAIAMGNLGSENAVKASHRRKRDYENNMRKHKL